MVVNKHFRLPYVADLIALKMANREQSTLNAAAIEFHATVSAPLSRARVWPQRGRNSAKNPSLATI